MKNIIIAGFFTTIVLFAIITIFIVNNEKKIKELTLKNANLEITKQTLEKNIQEQQKIVNNIYKKNRQQEKHIMQNAETLKIFNLSKADDKIKQEIASFNIIVDAK